MDNNYILLASICCIGWILMVILFRLFLNEPSSKKTPILLHAILYLINYSVILVGILLIYNSYYSPNETLLKSFKKMSFKSTALVLGSGLTAAVASVCFLFLLESKQHMVWSILLTLVVPILGIAIITHLWFRNHINFIGWISMIICMVSIIVFYKFGLQYST